MYVPPGDGCSQVASRPRDQKSKMRTKKACFDRRVADDSSDAGVLELRGQKSSLVELHPLLHVAKEPLELDEPEDACVHGEASSGLSEAALTAGLSEAAPLK